MKKHLILLAFLSVSLFSYSQTIKMDSQGNFIQVKDTIKNVSDKLTGKTFTTSKGETFPVYISKNGKYYVIRTSKSGTTYKQYLKA